MDAAISKGRGSAEIPTQIATAAPESVGTLSLPAYQRCYVHFLRNALDYVPRRVDDDCLQGLRWLYDRRDLAEARRDLAAWLAKWSGKYPKLTGWVEDQPARPRLAVRWRSALNRRPVQCPAPHGR